MTSFNVFKIHKNTQSFVFDSFRNASKAQQRLQINCDFATFIRIFLRSIFFNKRAIIDFVSFSLFFIKRSRLASCESSKKKRNRSSKNEADIIKQKSTATEKKRRDKSVKSNVASLNKEESNLSIKRKTVNEMKDVKSIRFETMKKKKHEKKVIKCIVMHDSASKLCARVTRRRIRCQRRFLFRRCGGIGPTILDKGEI